MQKEQKNLLVYGYGMAVILTVISLFQIFRHQRLVIGLALDILAIFFIVITALALPLLKTIYTYWMKAAHVIGGIVNAIVLIIVYYVMFGLAGLIFKLLGKDLLYQKWDPSAESYWIKRDEPDDPEHLKRQF
ncbi:MAG: hypothetical protein K8S27_01375 [Candidatus Omnitrophica bacterium]|nr:hypothetical protein [Candidatus Omnitrophota bacterium]